MFRKFQSCLYVLGVLAFLFFSPLEIEAQNQKILTGFTDIDLANLGPIKDMRTQVIKPLNIVFLGGGDLNFINIKVQPLKPLKGIDEVQWKIETPTGEILFEETLKDRTLWGNTFYKIEKEIEIPKGGIAKNSFLEVLILKGGKKIGYSTKKIPEIKLQRPKFGISHLRVRPLKSRGGSEDKYQSVRVDFENKNDLPADYIAQIKLINIDNPENAIDTQLLKSKEIKPKDTNNINTTIKEPKEDGNYRIETQILSGKDNKPLTGILRQPLKIGEERAGLNASLTEVILEITEDEDQIKFLIEGVSNELLKIKPLTLKLEYKQDNKDDEKNLRNLTTKEVELNSEDNWFTQYILIEADNTKNRILGTISVLSDGKTLSKKKIDRILSFKKDREALKQEKNLQNNKKSSNIITSKNNKTPEYSFWKYMILLFIFLVLIVLVYLFFYKRKNKINNFLLAILFSSFLSTVSFAATVTPTIESPLNGTYTSNKTPSITGVNGTQNNTINVIAGSSSCSAVVNSSGVWGCYLSPGLSIGSVNISITETDGISTSASTNLNITILAGTTVSAPNMTTATDDGISDSDNITTDNTPDFTGSCINGHTAKLQVDGMDNNAVICSGGNYTITANPALSNGVHSIIAILTNTISGDPNEGDVSYSQVLPVTINAPNSDGGNIVSTLVNYWYHPVVKWGFNPNATGDFENFKTIHFTGRAFDGITGKGAFINAPSRILVRFSEVSNTDNYFFIESLNFTVDENTYGTLDATRDYAFNIEAPTLMEEGEWMVEVIFFIDNEIYRSAWTDINGNFKTLVIDTTPPTFLNNVTYDGQEVDPLWPVVKPIQKHLGIKEFKRKQTLIKKDVNKYFRKKERKKRRNEIRKWNNYVQKLKDIESALENINLQIDTGIGNSAILNQKKLTLESEKNIIINGTNQTRGINQIKNDIEALTIQLGEDISENIISTSDLTSTVIRPTPLFSGQSSVTAAADGSIRGCVVGEAVTNTNTIDPSNIDFSGVDFSTINFSNIGIQNNNFSNVNFAEADYSNVDFTKATLNGTPLTTTDIQNIDFSRVDFGNLNFQNATLNTNGTISGVNFNIDINGQSIINFNNVNFNNTDYTTTDFTNVNFDNIQLTTGFNAEGCVQHYEEALTDLNTRITEQKLNLVQKKSRFKNTAIAVGIACTDNLSGCNPVCDIIDGSCEIDCTVNSQACDSYKIASSSSCPTVLGKEICDIDCELYPESCRIGDLSATIRANLCSDGDYCDQNAARSYSICDNVGNCTPAQVNTRIETDWYDPLSPGISSVSFIRNEGGVGGSEIIIDGAGSGDKLAAGDKINIRISASDPDYGDFVTDPTKYEDHGCGSDSASEFYKKEVNGGNDFCNQKNVACADDGFSYRAIRDQENGGTCLVNCPADLPDPNNPGQPLSYHEENGICVPSCDHTTLRGCFPFSIIEEDNIACTDTTWLPPTTSIPIGETFIQTSECGKTRNAIGTSTAFTKFDEGVFNLNFGH